MKAQPFSHGGKKPRREKFSLIGFDVWKKMTQKSRIVEDRLKELQVLKYQSQC